MFNFIFAVKFYDDLLTIWVEGAGLKTWKRCLIWMVRKSGNILQILHLWTFSKDDFKIVSQGDGKLYTY